MSGAIICGYDVETASDNTIGFLEGAEELHDRLGVPWTIYLTGKTLEKHSEMISQMVDNPLLNIAQHTYSHVLLKSI